LLATCAVAVLLGLFPLLAADPQTVKLSDTLSITVPQPVRLYFLNNRSFVGNLVGVTKTEVAFELNRAGAPTVRYKLEEIKAIEAGTDNDLFVFDAKKKEWDSLRARKEREEQEAKKTPFDKNPKAPAADDRICMVAEGTGATEAKAIAAAETDAATRAIWSVLDGITALDKQKEIEDKVLPGCEALAKGRSREIAGQRTTGVRSVTVRIGVVFDRKQIIERLAKAGIKVSDKPRGIAAALPKTDEIRRRRADYLHAVLADCFRTLTVSVMPGGIDDGLLTVHLQMAIDDAAYEVALANLLTVLEAIKRPENGMWETNVRLSKVQGLFPQYQSETWAGQLSKLSFLSEKEWDVWVLTKHRDDWSSATWRQYILDDTDVEQSLAGLSGRLGAEVYLTGVDGSVLGSSFFSCEGAVRAEAWKWVLGSNKSAVDNRSHVFVSPDALLLSAIVNQRTLNVKLKQVWSPTFPVRPLPPGQRIAGAQARLILQD
jgi:hypothetical protein